MEVFAEDSNGKYKEFAESVKSFGTKYEAFLQVLIQVWFGLSNNRISKT